MMTDTPSPNPRRAASAGFSLIELLVVVVLMGVGLLGLAALTTLTIRSNTSGRQRETAAILASNVMEQLIADGRQSGLIRQKGQTVPSTGYLLAGAISDVTYPYIDPPPATLPPAAGPTSTGTSFDLDGRANTINNVFTVTWARRAPKSGSPAATALTAGAEVVVNVTWTEAVVQSGGTPTSVPRWISVSRYINY